MSLRLYSIDYPDQFQPAHLQALPDRLPVAMQEKILRYRRWQDAYGSLLGKLLLETAKKKAGLPGDLNGLGVSAYGRPLEWATITGPEMPLLTFYRYWTAKESMIKADGRELQIPLVVLEISGGMGGFRR